MKCLKMENFEIINSHFFPRIKLHKLEPENQNSNHHTNKNLFLIGLMVTITVNRDRPGSHFRSWLILILFINLGPVPSNPYPVPVFFIDSNLVQSRSVHTCKGIEIYNLTLWSFFDSYWAKGKLAELFFMKKAQYGPKKLQSVKYFPKKASNKK